LRASVEIWTNGSAIAPFLFDNKWKGVISCGCNYDDDDMGCTNTYPDCPALTEPGMDFGNGFYDDHHFHYGYHIYASAVLAKFDPHWGKAFFEKVLALVRDVANPSSSDPFFPTFRHKDWFMGSSWASGVGRYSTSIIIFH
jgi:endo-1,3(4)-beta-glucanase